MLVEVDDPHWLSFIQAQPHAHIFHHPAWLRTLSSTYGYRTEVLTCAEGSADSAAVRAGLPFATLSGLFKRPRFVSFPFTDHSSPLAQDAQALAGLTERLEAWWQAQDRPPLEVRWELSDHFRRRPAAVVHELELAASPEQLLAGISKRHQRSLRKSEQAGLRLEHTTSLAGLRQFYQLHMLTRRRLGVPPQPWRFFQALWHHVFVPEMGFVLLVYQAEQPVAAAVFLHWQSTLVYKYGASDPAYWPLRPNHLLFWEAIRWGSEHGYRRLDFGRTDFDNLSLREFKANWGAAERPLVYSYLGAEPAEPAHGRLAHAARTLIQHSPPLVGRLVGELLYGRLA